MMSQADGLTEIDSQMTRKDSGCIQLTFPTRKRGYYDFWKASGKALDDAELQCDYAIKEMPSESPGLLDELKTSNDLYQCVRDICIRFERPAVNNVDARFQAANRIKSQIDLNPEPGPDPSRTAGTPNTSDTPDPDRNLLASPDNRLPLHRLARR